MSALPTGTVTLLFTDLEGSTRLLHQLGDAYPGVLADARELLREAGVAERAHEVDCHGDELFLAFGDAAAAARAAVAGQRAFAAHPWPEDARVRVRMGLHTGTPGVDGRSYVGLDVHRAARISAVGHGGQILLSGETRALVDADVRELGMYELAGLEAPEPLFQLLVRDLPSEFPPLRHARPVDFRPLRVALADDSVLIREGVASLLEDAGMHVVSQSGTADDLLRHVAGDEPDVVVVDIRMPPTHQDEGLRAARTIRSDHPGVGVLVLSQYVEPAYARDLLEDGAEGVGYLLKDRIADVDEFAAAVRRVADGGSAVDPELVAQLLGRPRLDDRLADLDERERQVLELVAEGRSDEAIAERLFANVAEVGHAVEAVFAKLGLAAAPADHRRVLAVLAFLEA